MVEAVERVAWWVADPFGGVIHLVIDYVTIRSTYTLLGGRA